MRNGDIDGWDIAFVLFLIAVTTMPLWGPLLPVGVGMLK